VVAILAFFIFYPLLRLVLLSLTPTAGEKTSPIVNVFTSQDFWQGLRTSIIVVIPASLIAVVVGAIMAWSNTRTDASLGVLGQIIPLTTFVIPHVAVASGWVMLAAPKVGLLSRWTEEIPLLGGALPSIYSIPGIIFVLSMTLVPFTFLIMQNAFSNLDPALEEASLTSGAGNLRTLAKVSIPALLHAIGGAWLLAMIVGLGEYTIPLILGTPARIDTLSVVTMRLVTASYPARLGEGAVIGLVLLVFTAAIWLIYFRVSKTGRIAQIGGKAASRGVMKLGPWKPVVRAITWLYFLFGTILPVLGLIVVSLQPFWGAPLSLKNVSTANYDKVFASDSLWSAITNSAMFAAIGALIITIVIAFLTSASKIARQSSADIGLSIVKVPSAIAHLVLAIGVLIAFFGPPFSLGGTAVLLIGTYVILFLPHASILGESATTQVRQELVEASETSGGSWWRTQRSVLGPLTAPAFISLYALTFALIAGETSASRILARPGTEVAGFVILQVYDRGLGLGVLAVLATLLAMLNLLVVGGLAIVSRNLRRNW
jgi:iron(III) transport system permease protein